MTKLGVEIKKSKCNYASGDPQYTAYLATFTHSDDRILIYKFGRLYEVINLDDCDGELYLQGASTVYYYNHKKIKKLTIEVELE